MSHVPGGGSGDTWSRVTVHQAIGITMEHLDCTGLAAFEVLVTLAEATGQTVSDLSDDIVTRRFRLLAVPDPN